MEGGGGFALWDYVVLAGTLLIAAAYGLYYAVAGGGLRTDAEFLVAERRLTVLPVSLSLTGSFMSAVTVLGTPAEVYRFGASFVLFSIAYGLVVLITSEVFLPVYFRLHITSTYQYLELRFNKQVRLLGTVLFIIQTILYAGIVIYAPALALNQVTGFELWGAVVITGIVCTLYCSLSTIVFLHSHILQLIQPFLLDGHPFSVQFFDIIKRAAKNPPYEGGLKAVVGIGIFQVLVMVAGFTSIIVQASKLQGGMKTIIKHAEEGGRLKIWDFNPSPLQRHTFWTITIGGTFTWAGIYGVNQCQVQRYLACRNKFQARVALYLNLLGLWTILSCAVLSGLSLYSVYRHCDPWTAHKVTTSDQLMPYLALEILHDYPGLPGLFVACAYSGTLSTVSSSITALSVVTVQDVIKPHLSSPSEKTLSLFSKGTSVFYGIFCIGSAALASLMGNVLQAVLSIFGMIGGPLLGLFTLGILNPFANSLGSFIGLIVGLIFSMWIGIGAHFYPPPPERTLELPLSIANCTPLRSTYLDLSKFSEQPFLMNSWKTTDFKRIPVMDNLYSLSYLYLSTFGTLMTILVGTIFSLLTGGMYQHIDRKYLLNKEDMTFGSFKKVNQVEVSASSLN